MKDNIDLAWTSLCQFQLSSPAPLSILSPATFVVSAVSHVKENIQTFMARVFSVMRAALAVPHLS